MGREHAAGGCRAQRPYERSELRLFRREREGGRVGTSRGELCSPSTDSHLHVVSPGNAQCLSRYLTMKYLVPLGDALRGQRLSTVAQLRLSIVLRGPKHPHPEPRDTTSLKPLSRLRTHWQPSVRLKVALRCSFTCDRVAQSMKGTPRSVQPEIVKLLSYTVLIMKFFFT